MKTINARQLRERYDDGRELAVLDVREEGVYSRDGHLLRVSNVPLSVLELRSCSGNRADCSWRSLLCFLSSLL